MKKQPPPCCVMVLPLKRPRRSMNFLRRSTIIFDLILQISPTCHFRYRHLCTLQGTTQICPNYAMLTNLHISKRWVHLAMLEKLSTHFPTTECYSCKGGRGFSSIRRMKGILNLSHIASFYIHCRYLVGNCVALIWISAPANYVENIYKNEIGRNMGRFSRARQ